MAKVKFIKDHLRHKAGEVADVLDAAANYYVRCGVAVYIKADAPVKTKTVNAPKAKRSKTKAKK